MRQELIMQFSTKTSGMFKTADSVTIQKLLKNADDDAFPALMAHKASVSPFQKYLTWGLFAFAVFMFGVSTIMMIWFAPCGTDEGDFLISLSIFIVSAMVMLVTFICGRLLKPSKSRAFREYSQILQAYQPK